MCRLYDVTEGTIRLNGIDIRKYNYEDYLRLFSAVFQDYRIFSLKVGENIAAGEDVDEERAWDALKRAGLQERFEKLPQGLDTFVGRKMAFYISHRLASCRFCQDILVFDEGKVVQRGSHEELVEQEGLYRELWEAQAQYYTV